MHCCRSILIRILLITVWVVSCGGDEAAVETMSTDVVTDGNRELHPNQKRSVHSRSGSLSRFWTISRRD